MCSKSQEGDASSQKYIQSLPVLIVYPLINYSQNDKTQQLINLTAPPFIVQNYVNLFSSPLAFIKFQAGNIASLHSIFLILTRILGGRGMIGPPFINKETEA